MSIPAESAQRGGPIVADASETPVQRTARLLDWQATACDGLGSPLYAGLLRFAATDLLSGGPTADVLAGHLADPGRSALALRMLGGAHALALTGQAPELATFYPSAGGSADPGAGGSRAWPALRRVLATQGEAVRAWLDHAPQTNEVGRGAVLVGLLCHLVARADLPVRLVEVGASAGLNLRADRFRITGAGVAYGDESSPVQMPGGWRGDAPPVRPIEVAWRTGGDVSPIDPATAAGRTRLTAYVWPDQIERLARLRGALDLAADVAADLRTEPASRTISRIGLEPGTWTVVWHSIMRQYLSADEAAALAAGVASLGATASGSARFAYLTFELVRWGAPPAELAAWPGAIFRRMGTAPAHGVPVNWVG
jgi:hypothetical protein